MPKLTARQAAVYEYLKKGKSTTKEISKATKLPMKTIDHNIHHLLAIDFIVRSGNRKGYIYKVEEVKEYTLGQYSKIERPANEKITPSRSKLNLSGYEYEFTEKQVSMLQAFKNEKLIHDGKIIKSRTPLSKLTGIPKLTLNFALERMG